MSGLNLKQKIMIVDDEPRNQRILMETLENLSENRICLNGEEILNQIDEFLPDLVLLDIMMPDLDGYEVCKRIRAKERLKTTKIIMVSGKAMTEEKLKGYEWGADDYITKPFISEELLAKAKVFLRLSKFEKEMDDLNLKLDEKVKEKTRQLYEAESLLINSAKMAALGEMSGGVAHEINNPLASINLVSDQIRELISRDPIRWQSKIIEMSWVVSQAVKHIASIVHGLQTFARDASHDAFDLAPLKPIVNNTLNLCQAKFSAGNVKLMVDEIDENFHVYCRPVQVTQVLLNLISNAHDAIEYLPERWIRVSFQEKDEGIVITVTDSGSGISDSIRDKIFQPLFTTKEVGKGTGLGLSISKGIVEAHSGRLTVNKDSLNTQFVLWLPKQAQHKKIAIKNGVLNGA
jgi:signal transduction histidine kinase